MLFNLPVFSAFGIFENFNNWFSSVNTKHHSSFNQNLKLETKPLINGDNILIFLDKGQFDPHPHKFADRADLTSLSQSSRYSCSWLSSPNLLMVLGDN